MTKSVKWLTTIGQIVTISAAVIAAYGQITSANINSQALVHVRRIEAFQKVKEADPEYCKKHLLDANEDVKLVCGVTAPQPDLWAQLPGTWLDGNRARIKLWNKDDSLNWLGRGSGGRLVPKDKLFFDFHYKNLDGSPCCTGIVSSDGSAIAFDNNTAWVKRKELPTAKLIQSFRKLF